MTTGFKVPARRLDDELHFDTVTVYPRGRPQPNAARQTYRFTGRKRLVRRRGPAWVSIPVDILYEKAYNLLQKVYRRGAMKDEEANIYRGTPDMPGPSGSRATRGSFIPARNELHDWGKK